MLCNRYAKQIIGFMLTRSWCFIMNGRGFLLWQEAKSGIASTLKIGETCLPTSEIIAGQDTWFFSKNTNITIVNHCVWTSGLSCQPCILCVFIHYIFVILSFYPLSFNTVQVQHLRWTVFHFQFCRPNAMRLHKLTNWRILVSVCQILRMFFKRNRRIASFV